MLETETRDVTSLSDGRGEPVSLRRCSGSSTPVAGAAAAGEHQPQRERAREDDHHHHNENRARFEAALEGILGADIAPKGSSAHRVYEVFVAYFLHQALHHDKALSAHRLTVTLLGDPSAPAKGRRLKYSMTGEEREPNEFLEALRTSTSASTSPIGSACMRECTVLPLQSNEKFFATAAAWLGDDLSLALKALLRRVKISFVASRFLGGGKKIWVNWEWVGSLYGDSSAHVLGSDERWNTASIRQQAACPPEHHLRVEAGTPEEGGIVGPYSEPTVPEQSPRASVDSRSFLSPASAATAPVLATTHFTIDGSPAMSAHEQYQLYAAGPHLHGAAEPYAFSYPSDANILLSTGECSTGMFTQSGDQLAATPIKEKRSLGKKISRGLHKLTHHHHHHDE